MRDDMCKVIVERPRLRFGKKSINSSDGKAYRDRVEHDEDGGHAPQRLGMKAGYRSRKWLNENLAPLRRWLESQVHRPWNKVYSDLCANIDRRNTVQEHIFSHIEQFVAVETRLVDGEVQAMQWWGGGYGPIGESSPPLFVHPRTGILLPNRQGLRYQRKLAETGRAKAEAAVGHRRILGAFEQLHLIDGIWYLVTLAALPSNERPATGNELGAERWDVVRRKMVSRNAECDRGPGSAWGTYGSSDLYATRKRQLGTRELKRYGVTNQQGRDSRSCFFGFAASMVDRVLEATLDRMSGCWKRSRPEFALCAQSRTCEFA